MNERRYDRQVALICINVSRPPLAFVERTSLSVEVEQLYAVYPAFDQGKPVFYVAQNEKPLFDNVRLSTDLLHSLVHNRKPDDWLTRMYDTAHRCLVSLRTFSVKFNAWHFKSKEQDILSILTWSTNIWANLLELRRDQANHRVKEIDEISGHWADQIGSREWPSGKRATRHKIHQSQVAWDRQGRISSLMFHGDFDMPIQDDESSFIQLV